MIKQMLLLLLLLLLLNNKEVFSLIVEADNTVNTVNTIKNVKSIINNNNNNNNNGKKDGNNGLNIFGDDLKKVGCANNKESCGNTFFSNPTRGFRMDIDEISCCGGVTVGPSAPFSTRTPVLGKNGMAATSHPLATSIATDILKKGGSAVDAAIAANAALGLMEPTGSGIGGDLFAIVYNSRDKKLYGINSSGRMPKNQTLDELKSVLASRGLDKIPRLGCLSMSVPGAVEGWFELHSRFGNLPFSELLQPSIDYARDGFPVTEVIGHYWQNGINNFIANQDQIEGGIEYLLRTFTIDGNSTAPYPGKVFRNLDLANTYETIARDGREAFYNGEIADKLDSYWKRVGCKMDKINDLSSHFATWETPQKTSYRGKVDVHELMPNGQGIGVLQALNILEGFDLRSMGFNSADYLHVLTETKKIVFEDRARYYADPAFSYVPVEGLISKEYAAERRSLINMSVAQNRIEYGDPSFHHSDTVYLSTADKEGNMVSLIQSNFRGMGSGMAPDGLGFIIQDRGELMNVVDESHPNVYAPGKRPFHTIIPGFVTKYSPDPAGGEVDPIGPVGVMGGDQQVAGHVMMVVNMVDFGFNNQEAGDAARFSHDYSSDSQGYLMTDGGSLSLEPGVPDHVRDELINRGHKVTAKGSGDFGGYQSIVFDSTEGVYWGI